MTVPRAAAVGATLALAACASLPRVFPPSPDAGAQLFAPQILEPPGTGYDVLALRAAGVQQYECRLGDTGPRWVMKGPKARLYGPDDKLIGRHDPGPSWTLDDGSRVTAHVIAQAPSDQANSIEQLLLVVDRVEGSGALAGTRYVQRLRTSGGLARTSGCDAAHAGMTDNIEYSARYLFFRKKAP